MSGQDPSAGRIRRAEAEDAARLAALHGRCFPEEPWNAEAFRRLLAMPGALAAVQETEAALDGLILLRRAADEVEVIALAVTPASRRRGIGRRLLERALAKAAEDGARRAFLEVAEDNAAARRLYAAAGFRLCGRRKDYYARRGGARCDALVLAAPLL